MKIVHLCLSCFYIDDFAYQENELVAQNVADGHEVTVIASTETFDLNRQLSYTQPGRYLGSDGAIVIRLPYREWLPQSLMRKLRAHPGVYRLLCELGPDVILFHGACGWELNAAARYKRTNPLTKLFVDSHEDFHNSAKSLISKYLLHFVYYRSIILRNLHLVDKILYISLDTKMFLQEFYRLPLFKLEFFPLGGRVFSDEDYLKLRRESRGRYGLGDADVLFVQSGKIDNSKRLLESLGAFSKLSASNVRFLIAGHLQDTIARVVESLMENDERIGFVGWQTPVELRNLLCAADVYVQPFGQTATTQMSLCSRCAIVVQDLPSHRVMFCNNGFLIDEMHSLASIFFDLAGDQDALVSMQQASGEFAKRCLDYRVLSRRLCE